MSETEITELRKRVEKLEAEIKLRPLKTETESLKKDLSQLKKEFQSLRNKIIMTGGPR